MNSLENAEADCDLLEKRSEEQVSRYSTLYRYL